jgi:amidophosphoribosyltransferase
MCGIIGLISNESTQNNYNRNLVNDIHIGLVGLQHRGQDAVGICNEKSIIKKVGLVKNLFQNMEYVEQMRETLKGNMLMGHVRYLTSGNDNESSIQPLDINVKDTTNVTHNIKMCHNGNILNVDTLQNAIDEHSVDSDDDGGGNNSDSAIDSDSDKSLNDDVISDSSLLLKLIAILIKKQNFSSLDTNQQIQKIFDIVQYLHTIIIGSYNLLIHINNFGLIVIRDKFGIRPLSYAKKAKTYLFASEDNIYNTLNYSKINDIGPGETIIFNYHTNKLHHDTYSKSYLSPCLFEYIYFARSDSTIDKINVYKSRQLMGEILGNFINKQYGKLWCNGMSIFQYNDLDIDIIVPVPETGRLYAYGVQKVINKPIVEALVKNNYIDRTFIMETQGKIINNINSKFTVVNEMVRGKNILIVDDSIVRGNTSRRINQLFRQAGVKKIYFASGSPRIYFPNHYGINIKTSSELICHQKTDEQVAQDICADKVIFNDLDVITKALKKMNKNIDRFETSIFNNIHLYKQISNDSFT